jgi:hypothetical protein
MNGNVQQSRALRGTKSPLRAGLARGSPTRGSRGFSALELLVIAAIVCVVVAIGVPTLHARAKTSVLEANLASLGSIVGQQAADGYSPEYRQSGQGDPTKYLSNHLETSLHQTGRGSYVNPTVDAAEGHAIVNTSIPPSDPQSIPPAVLITDSPQYRYVLFNTLAETARRTLAGTLVVAFDTQGKSIDVFFVDAGGQKSVTVVSVPLG